MKARQDALRGISTAFLIVVALSPAVAADAPVNGAREPLYRCETAKFWELPGTDTCLKIGGHVRFVTGVNEDQLDSTEEFDPAAILVPDGHTSEDTFWMYAQARINIDARTPTEFGLLRGFAEWQADDDNSSTGGALGMRHGYVQIGNWLFGKTGSIFLHGDSTPNYSDAVTIPGDPTIRVVQARYMQPFGNGLRFAIALEDPARFSASGTTNNYLSPAATVTDSRNDVPNVAASLRADSDWGKAHISGALQENSFTYTDAAGQHSEREIGWAALAGLALAVPTGEGDSFFLKGIYTNGASGYAQATAVSVVADTTTTAVYENVETWTALAGFTHNWSPTLNSSVIVSYGNIDYNSPVGAGGVTADLTDTQLAVVGNIFWNPTGDLELGVEGVWGRRQILSGADNDSLGLIFQGSRYF